MPEKPKEFEAWHYRGQYVNPVVVQDWIFKNVKETLSTRFLQMCNVWWEIGPHEFRRKQRQGTYPEGSGKVMAKMAQFTLLLRPVITDNGGIENADRV